MVEYTSRRDGFLFMWKGGAYIDIALVGKPDKVFEVINVYDYGKGEITIPFTQKALSIRAKKWLMEHRNELDNYREHARYL